MSSNKLLQEIWAPLILVGLGVVFLFIGIDNIMPSYEKSIQWFIAATVSFFVGMIWLVITFVGLLRADYFRMKSAGPQAQKTKKQVQTIKDFSPKDKAKVLRVAIGALLLLIIVDIDALSIPTGLKSIILVTGIIIIITTVRRVRKTQSA